MLLIKLQYLWAHRVEIAGSFMALLIAYTPIATILARKIPRPAPTAKWYWRALFDLFVDTPAWAAALGRAGIFGGAFNLPGLPSRQVQDNPTPAATAFMRSNSDKGRASLVVIMALAACGFLLACTMGCAPGTDGLRQACAETDAVLTGVYQVAAATYHAREQALRSQVTPATVESIKDKWAGNDVIYSKVLAFLDGAKDSKDATCALAPAIDAGLKKDLAALIAQVIKIAADVRSAVAELQKLARCAPHDEGPCMRRHAPRWAVA